MLTYRRPVSASAQSDYRIAVTFEDGSKGVFDFTPYIDYPCYAKLRDASFFAQVRPAHGTLAWPDDIDIAPETVWERSVRD